ncbi:hypothetical protein PGIGA_G00044120 [Pangasianodon gigas]|uniref:Uncharacterized protein n=1 Tax=Pangasianodon gigas TaxID=30993 RepID=A0ACC5X1J2_PANGG|nr:hypothetical protein [Pangasianodon gigas]
MFKLLLFSQLVVLQPGNGLVTPLNHFLLVLFTDFAFHAFIFHTVFHVEGIRLQGVLGCNLLSLTVILCFVLICFLHHPLNLLLAQPALVIGDGDLVLFAGAFVHSRHVQNAVGVYVKSHFDLRNSTWCRWDARQIKLPQ